MAAEIPIYRVSETGSVERLGFWQHDARTLVLEREGFPLLDRGTHRLEGDLPWLFWDMCPSGFLGQRLAVRWPSLRLPPNPRDWNRDEALRALTEAGSELAGNLLIGDLARDTFATWGWNVTSLEEELRSVLSSNANAAVSSSLGGERPKFIFHGTSGEVALVKFSPPRDTPAGVRWSDLLEVELLCSRTLSHFGVSACKSSTSRLADRMSLFIRRFDRLANRGRIGASTLYWLTMDRWGDVQFSGPEVVRRLVAAGQLPEEDATTCERVQAFSEAIGNNDTHLGNYGLVFDAHGRARLAPIYDVLPMILAPRNDELPDRYLSPRATPIAAEIRPWVEHLATLVEGDDAISREFKDLWRRYVGL